MGGEGGREREERGRERRREGGMEEKRRGRMMWMNEV